jgi:predicted membrane-bound spermidine synthase
MSIKTPAECLHTEPKRIPILTGGEISPVVLRLWEMACEDFFAANRKLEAADYVGAVLPGLKDMRIRDWIASRRA